MSKHITFNKNVIECDWITVGSFDERNRRRWETVLSSEFAINQYEAKQQMYVGTRYTGGFVGQGEQRGLVHTICKVTGANANKVLYRILRASAGNYRFTRMDIQLTIDLPEFHSARKLADHLKSSQNLSIRLIENGGMDTVYVGSRQSARMWRIYVKEDSEKNLYLRFELEVKNGKDNLADRLALNIKKNGHRIMASYFFNHLDRLNLPEAYTAILSDFRTGGTAPLPKEVRDTGGKTWRWLDGVVKNSIIKYASESHGRAEYVINWLIEIIDTISRGMKNEQSGN